MDLTEYRIQSGLISHWTELTTCLRRLRPSASLAPSNAYDVISFSGRDNHRSVTFELGPVVLAIPERPNHTTNDLFVVIAGLLTIDRHLFEETSQLRTISFATKVAYFRRKQDGLQHVYGAHYDFSKDELGHPVFHAQLKSLVDSASSIAEHFEDITVDEDHMNGVLKTVRLPCAQMDVFSLFVQVIADHLLWNNSSNEEKQAFSSFLAKSKAMQGAASQVIRLQTLPATACYRAAHWYPPGTPQP